jgi:hypothetical protein
MRSQQAVILALKEDINEHSKLMNKAISAACRGASVERVLIREKIATLAARIHAQATLLKGYNKEEIHDLLYK